MFPVYIYFKTYSILESYGYKTQDIIQNVLVHKLAVK